jgi:hypothetical protein
MSEGATNLIVVAISAPAALLVAWLFTPVNEFAITVSRRLGRVAVSGWDSWFRQQKPEPIARLS